MRSAPPLLLLGLLPCSPALPAPPGSDCRFWPPGSPRPPPAPPATTGDPPAVFYWWDSTRALCRPCTRCGAALVTLRPCSLARDTGCGEREELAGPDYDYQYEEEGGQEATLHYETLDMREEEEEVFGSRHLEQGGPARRSPTRAVLRHRQMEQGGLKRRPLPGPAEQYGRPEFFQTEEDAGVANSVVQQAERPILEVARELLASNVTASSEERETETERERDWLRGPRTSGHRRPRSTTALALPPGTDTEGYDGVPHAEAEASTKSAGDSAFREIFHLLEDEGRRAVEGGPPVRPHHLATLQYVLGVVSCLVGILLLFLLAVLLRPKLSSKFKLFDEKNVGDDEYQSMASLASRSNSATTTLPASRLASVSSPDAASPPAAVVRSLRNIRPTVVDQAGRTQML